MGGNQMPELSAEALLLIQATAVQANGALNKAMIVPLPQEPKYLYGIVDSSSGKLRRVEAAPKPRDHKLVTLDQIIKFAEHVSGQVQTPPQDSESETAELADELPDTPPGQTVVWYDRGAVIVICDDLTRRDRATMPLTFTPQLALLQGLEANQAKFDQREFRRLLKIKLAGCLQDTQVLNWISAMKFQNSSTASGVITSQRASLGAAIDDEALSDLGSCPETMNLQVRIFDDPSLRGTWPVACAVEVLAEERQFRLLPLPLQLHDAIESELSVLGQHLSEALKCPVFRGAPE
jgi:hypothetical protein